MNESNFNTEGRNLLNKLLELDNYFDYGISITKYWYSKPYSSELPKNAGFELHLTGNIRYFNLPLLNKITEFCESFNFELKITDNYAILKKKEELENSKPLPSSIARRLDFLVTTTMNVEKLLKINKKNPIVLNLLEEVKKTAQVLINTIKSDYQ